MADLGHDHRSGLGMASATPHGLTALGWGALATIALAVEFVVTSPVNRWMIGRGPGRARSGPGARWRRPPP